MVQALGRDDVAAGNAGDQVAAAAVVNIEHANRDGIDTGTQQDAALVGDVVLVVGERAQDLAPMLQDVVHFFPLLKTTHRGVF